MASTTTSALALKEWGAVAHALLQGRQSILLRKGGIHEKVFEAGGRGAFVLFPTVAHSHGERVRPEHADLLPLGEADVEDDGFVVRCGVRVIDTITVARPEGLPAVAHLHIWTDESVRRDRLEFRPRHALQILVVQALALPTATIVARQPEHGGCRSWVDVAVRWDGNAGSPALEEPRLLDDAARVRREVG